MPFVKLENLNDFIAPSSACIKPVENKPGTVAKVSDISLSDCLACSGCITSAETVLVEQQNYDELFNVINANKVSKVKRQVVVSLSLQAIASLAHKYSLGIQDTAERIAGFFTSIGCDKVYDINLARQLALVESYKEFKMRRKDQPKKPIISSICPGWVCYSEKSNGELIIPYMSKVRSPQQIMGALLKRTLSDSQRNGNDIFHVTLMPCFDKKLEASRQDFKDQNDESQDVDIVLTPVELEEIMRAEEVTLRDFIPRKLDILMKSNSELDRPLTSHFGSVSGGYAENLLLAEVSELLGIHNCDSLKEEIEYRTYRNNDFIEISIKKSFLEESNSKNSSGAVISESLPLKIPRFAIVNGFRNIQTIVQRLKQNALKYDYVELMACPSGCINGGAQCRPNEGEEQAPLIESVKSLYETIPIIDLGLGFAEANKNKEIYEKLSLNEASKVDQLLYTEFHPVPKTENLTLTNW